jgi:hypothetical protein
METVNVSGLKNKPSEATWCSLTSMREKPPAFASPWLTPGPAWC